MPDWIHPLYIGPVLLPDNVALAPMSGTSDLSFRRICRRMGAGLTVTELVSARGIRHDPFLKKSWRYLAIDPADNPVAIQLFGADPDDFTYAIQVILEHPILSQCSMIDLNMGCPAAKVVRNGAGAALMRTPDLAARIVEAAVNAARPARMPVTVKFRKGWNEDQVNAPGFARLCESAGAAAVTIHGRTCSQMYGGRSDPLIIAAVRQAVSIPVFGNGDIRSADDAKRMILETGVDGIMVGRAAQGNPWIFREIIRQARVDSLTEKQPEFMRSADTAAGCCGLPADEPAVPTLSERAAVFEEQLRGLCGLAGEQTAVREMRRHLAYYLRGIPGSAAMKVRGMAAVSCAEMMAVWEEWLIC